MRKSRWMVVGMLAVMALLYFLMFYFTPPQIDDLLFREYYLSGDGLRDMLSLVRSEENGRLPNVLCGLWEACLPGWVGGMLLALSAVGMVYAGAWLASGRPPGRVTIAVTWLLVAVLMPWRHQMFVTDVALNYLPVTLMTTVVMILYMRPGQPCLAWRVIVITLSFFAGMQHEGASLIVAGGMAMYAIGRRLRLSPFQWWLFAAFIAGTFVLLTSPGLWNKLDASGGGDYGMLGMIKGAPAILLLIVAISVMAALRRLPAGLRDPFWCFVAMGIAGLLMQWYVGAVFVRSGWFGEFYSIIALVMLCRRMPRVSIKWRRIICIAAFAIPAVLLVASSVVQRRIMIAHRHVLAMLDGSPSGTVFYDWDGRSPRWVLRYPAADTWNDPTQLIIASAVDRSGRIVAVIPKALEEYDDSLAQRVPGTAGTSVFRGELAMPYRPLSMLDGAGKPLENCPVELDEWDYVTGTGRVEDVPTQLQVFTLPDGRRMLYVRPLVREVAPPYIRIDK